MYKIIHQDALPSEFLQQLASFPWYDSTIYNSLTQKLDLGSVWFQGKNAFMYVKADAALALGQLATYTVPATSTWATNTALNSGIWTAGSLTINAEVGNWLYGAGASPATTGTLKPVKENTATVLTFSKRDQGIAGPNPAATAVAGWDADVLPAGAPWTGTCVGEIIRPGHVSVNDATHTPVGVALGTVTQNYYTVIQVVGLAIGLTGASSPALVTGQLCVPGAAGVINGASSGATPYMGSGSIVSLSTYNTSASILTPFMVNMLGNC